MKTRITLVAFMLFLGFNLASAQDNEKDINTLSLMTEAAKADKCDEAYKYFMEIRERNPKFHLGIYKYGEDILECKIEKSSGAEKTAFINDLVKLWEQRGTYFASKTPKGEYAAKACQLKYDNREALGLSDQNYMTVLMLLIS